MTARRHPAHLDPTNQSGRPLLVTAAVVALLVVLALMVAVYFLSV